MKLSTIAASFLLQSLAVNAQIQEGSIVVGGAGPGCQDEGEVCQAFIDAGRNPNVTDSVKFTRSFNDTEQEWTWRINITEVAIPGRISELANPNADYSGNQRVLNTQWELVFPGDAATLEQSLYEVGNATLEFRTFSAIMAANISEKYDQSANGDCTSLLGAACASDIQNDITSSSTACRDTLGAQIMYSYAPGGAGSSYTANATDGTYERGDTFISRNSPLYTAGNNTVYDLSRGALSVLVLNFKPSPEQGTIQGADTTSVVLCRIVDKDVAQTLADDPAGDSAASSLLERVPAAYAAGILMLFAFWL